MVELGEPIPVDSSHSISVSLPKWNDNVDYEEGRNVHLLKSGYPRFVFHSSWMKKGKEIYKKDCLVFSNQNSAIKCKDFLIKRGFTAKIEILNTTCMIYFVLFSEEAISTAKQFWQHTGEGISSRYAEFSWNMFHKKIHAKKFDEFLIKGNEAKDLIKKRLISLYNVEDNESIYLYPCGMNAIFHCYQAITAIKQSGLVAQFGFPYLDTLKIFQKFDGDCYFYGFGDKEDILKLETLINSGHEVSAIFCEVPSNPLLKTPDLRKLRKISLKHGIPLVIDDTIGNPINTKILYLCDMVVSSLTKIFSGYCNVLSGSVTLNTNGPFYLKLKNYFESKYYDNFWAEDAIQLEVNSRLLEKRITVTNHNAEKLCDFLTSHPLVDKIYYPKYTETNLYQSIQNTKDLFSNDEYPNGGYGSLFSIILKQGNNSEKNSAQIFFDNLDIYKGPSLGTNFTLACPYTLIAHYNELEEVEKYGISRWLIRVSVGMEPIDEIIGKFKNALNSISDL